MAKNTGKSNKSSVSGRVAASKKLGQSAAKSGQRAASNLRKAASQIRQTRTSST